MVHELSNNPRASAGISPERGLLILLDVAAEENQEECLGIQDQASAEVQVSMQAHVSHCHLLAKRRAGLQECIL